MIRDTGWERGGLCNICKGPGEWGVEGADREGSERGGGEGAERGKIDDKTKQKKRNKKGKTTKYTEMR